MSVIGDGKNEARYGRTVQGDDADDEELVDEVIDEFGITFSRPAFWSFRREHEQTYLYWDPDAGSLRITPIRGVVDIERYLAGVFDNERDHAPTWRTIGGHKGVAWIADSESRCHFVVTGRDHLAILCSYAYDPELYAEDDDFYGPAVDVGLEHYDAVLASLKF
jgi:hypothetical protein